MAPPMGRHPGGPAAQPRQLYLSWNHTMRRRWAGEIKTPSFPRCIVLGDEEVPVGRVVCVIAGGNQGYPEDANNEKITAGYWPPRRSQDMGRTSAMAPPTAGIRELNYDAGVWLPIQCPPVRSGWKGNQTELPSAAAAAVRVAPPRASPRWERVLPREDGLGGGILVFPSPGWPKRPRHRRPVLFSPPERHRSGR